ncbi:MAG: diguanylate cyclase [Peptococcaceae bacterium]|nr:diguanylate cyclase [Peptococcaceae bacterium]
MKKFYAVIVIITILFILVSVLSFSSINQLQGNASVVNYCGIVRGGTQKLIKEELMGRQDDALIEKLNVIIINLDTGEGPHNLVLLPDDDYQDKLKKIKVQWAQLKEDIAAVRQDPSDENRNRLFADSQDYFDLANDLTFAADTYSEGQVKSINFLFLIINGVFVFLFLVGVVYVLRGVIVSRNASNPDRISYIDPMTNIDNRASCDRLISKINMSPSVEDIAVIMLNMNGITIVNNKLGQKVGDKIITDFAQILKDTCKDFGFVGRYGGDEFISIVAKASPQMIKTFIKELDREVWSYNGRQRENLRKISFAVGYVVGNLMEITIDDMIYEAYRNMTEDKDRSKKGPL